MSFWVSVCQLAKVKHFIGLKGAFSHFFKKKFSIAVRDNGMVLFREK